MKTANSNQIIKVTKDYVYNDPSAIYDRPPYVAKFSIENSNLSLKEFFLGNVHIRPTNVLNETLELRYVVNEILAFGETKNIGILGDFNFDCQYISGKSRDLVRTNLTEFVWYISDKVATSIRSSTSCALDRIILAGKEFNSAVVPKSNKTNHYYNEFNMNLTEALKISDHLPVEINFI